MRTVELHGEIGERFGRRYDMHVDSPAEAIRALVLQMPALKTALLSGEWHVHVADRPVGEADLRQCIVSHDAPVHIIPAVGGGGRGVGKAILGVALVAGAFFTGGGTLAGLSTTAFGGITYGNIAVFGAAMASWGISQIIAGTPEVNSPHDLERPDDRPSFLASSPKNTSQEGGIVPVCYGDNVYAGGAVISANLVIESFDD